MSTQLLLTPILSFLKCETPVSWIQKAALPENLSPLLIDHCNCELKAAQTAMFLLRKYAVDAESGKTLLAWAKPYEDFVYQKDRDIGQFLLRRAQKNAAIGELTPNAHFAKAPELIAKMVRLIKEEFHHFEQVLALMHTRGIEYQNMNAGRYAKGMMKQIRTFEPAALVDKLIAAAFIEARSCERFAVLAPHLDDELNKFYVSLLRSEARHYQDYLTLAESIAETMSNSGTNKKPKKISNQSVKEDIQSRIALFATVEAELISMPDSDFKFHSGTPK
ncbi:tRNA isopentenyl-2-thiomethyl-A-37 hydroxylase MiaE [Shewanella surugensis]|uniref:tRNA isopentenyl-2-thiomethyl-A-37 hydroxylase MiaE n=1 Tax=Shewanella surugensis TaxID=212020 RepID=A0ABT0LI46_9GAMM|nr:tRNA isopentenyl-2-thiomethyl-A-37 hydroxylase MiaE [Shewanella surugensis]MCL1127030.1 tRNA isopentenyl-2-thiomethyl-A-37 hydroxylase MiaE [Shewanella surugensis]